MPLAPGSRIGPYEITSPLGAGGMGEVFLARDTRLGREVAIKALPEAFAHDGERLARFEREARLLASLKHPNIAAIYGLEEADGRRYLILEYVPGPTLADRLRDGALPLDESLDVCMQIAAGLEAAHESGVVHRDLKPANVKLTPAGDVKVLDFGLAKGGGGAVSGTSLDLSNSPTIAAQAATTAGVILGTAAYMSPEQARGRVVDRRSDIWSFGCVLYECLTGRPLHSGDTVSDLIARILEREPDWSALPANTPPRLRELLARCLRKDARERLRDIGDARLELAEIRSRGPESATAAAAAPRRTRRGSERVAWILAGVLAVVSAASLAMSRTPHGRVTRMTVLAPDQTIDVSGPSTYAMAPDGHAVAFLQQDSVGVDHLFVRDLDAMEARRLNGTDDAIWPFWSPDSRDLGFFAKGRLRRVSAGGGPVRDLCEASQARGGSWGDGQIVFAPSPRSPIYAVSDEGGTPRAVTAFDSTRHEISHRFPVFLSDHRHFTFATEYPGTDRTSPIFVASLTDPHAHPLMESASAPVFAPPDWLLFIRDRALLAQRLDLGQFRMQGRAVVLDEPLETQAAFAQAPVVSCSREGSLLYLPAEQRPKDLVWVAPNGLTTPVGIRVDASISSPRFAPDLRRVALSGVAPDGFSFLIADLEQRRLAQILPPGRGPMYPVWDPSGTWVAGPLNAGGADLRRFDVVSGADSVVMPSRTTWRIACGWTPDERILVYNELTADRRYDIGYLTLADGVAHTYLSTVANEGTARLSHDGHWAAYVSDASGRIEVFIDGFPDHRAAARVGPTSVGLPLGTGGIWWSRDDRQIYYTGADGVSVMVASVQTSPRLAVGEPRLFLRLSSSIFDFDFSPDRGRAIGLLAAGRRPSALTVVQNWTADITERR